MGNHPWMRRWVWTLLLCATLSIDVEAACVGSNMAALVVDLEATIANISKQTDQASMEAIVQALSSYERAETWIECNVMAMDMVTLGTATQQITGTGCHHVLPGKWGEDPCCNKTLQYEQCCVPKATAVEVAVVESVDAGRCDDEGVATRLIEKLVESLRATNDCTSAWTVDMWVHLMKFYTGCYRTVHTQRRCQSDDDCYTSCDPVGHCRIPFSATQALAVCHLETMDIEMQRMLRKKLGLTGDSSDEAFAAAYQTQMEDLTCVGPSGHEYSERWRVSQISQIPQDCEHCWCRCAMQPERLRTVSSLEMFGEKSRFSHRRDLSAGCGEDESTMCFKATYVPADEAGCTSVQSCNWDQTIASAAECTAPQSQGFCADCLSFPEENNCVDVSRPASCYTWVKDPSECAAMGGAEGPWGPWHCVFPDLSAAECVQPQYCASGLRDDKKACGGICVVPSSSEEECDALNDLKTRMSGHLVCDQVHAMLSEQAVAQGFGDRSLVRANLQARRRQLEAISKRCALALNILSVSPERDGVRTEEDSGLHAWNYYVWEGNVESGDGYCQVGNMWGPEVCTGTEVEWIPWRTYERAQLNDQASCEMGRCSADAKSSAEECAQSSCAKPCRKCRSNKWGSSLCFSDTTHPDACTAIGGVLRDSRCVLEYVNDAEGCTAFGRGFSFQECEALSLDQCARCAVGDPQCPVDPMLGCHVHRWDTCDTQEECLTAGSCDDWEFGEDGVCVFPFNISDGRPQCPAKGGDSRNALGWARIGCIDAGISKQTDCNGTWKRRAHTADECAGHGRGCEEPQFLPGKGLTAKDADTCKACGGTMRDYYSWTPGVWAAGEMQVSGISGISRRWKERKVEPENGWVAALNYTKLWNAMGDVAVSRLGTELETQALCKYGRVASSLEALACECSSGDTCPPIEGILAAVGSGEFFSAMEKTFTFIGNITLTVGNGSVASGDSVHITVSTIVTDILTWISGSSGKEARDLDPFAVVHNDNGATVGQVLGDPVYVNLSSPLTNVTLCLSQNGDIPEDAATYPTRDFGMISGKLGILRPMNVSITYSAWGQFCGQINISAAGYFAPIRRITDYQSVCMFDACGVCNGDGSTCITGNAENTGNCCPGWTGGECDVEDLCYGLTCLNSGLCDPLNGRCVCPVGFVGLKCELPACSDNGYFDIQAQTCVCDYGWAGEDCSQCASGHAGKRHICIPMHEKGYVLWSVPETSVPGWLDGTTVSTFSPERSAISKAFDRAILPGSYDPDQVYRDCRCQPVQETQDSRTETTSVASMHSGSSGKDGAQTMGKGIPVNPTGKRVGYASSEAAKRKMSHYNRVSATILHLNRAIKEGRNLKDELGQLAIERIQNSQSPSERLSIQRERKRGVKHPTVPDKRDFGHDVVRVWHDSEDAFWVMRDNEPPFFEDTMDQCIAESALSSQEKEELSDIYEDCIDAFEATNGNLEKCEQMCDSGDDDGSCDGLAIAFWPLLAITILSVILVILLGACLLFRPVRHITHVQQAGSISQHYLAGQHAARL